MCGIVGVISRTSIKASDWLIAGRDAMAHRGPDDAGVWWSEDCRVGLGHRRLAIIDLSPAGHQPMQDAAGLLTIVFHWGVFNYRGLPEEIAAKGDNFRAHSDNQVVFAAEHELGTGS